MSRSPPDLPIFESSRLREGKAQGVFTGQLFQALQVRIGVEEPISGHHHICFRQIFPKSQNVLILIFSLLPF